ncbi:MerR family transcriptional regulator [Bradyrhizobium sp. SYSU BS000235]|uniref:MerR family transcriptional regulator n=1 Tax=Bradyrhizobium sp. SYSU BS000235 TaxID=3411332 RepID=UPI003C7427EF
MDKAPDAFRTISEVADDLDVPQHVLRFWETRFTQIKPMKRSGGRRYYRPDDVNLLRGIRRLLYGEGYTIRGVQRILREHGVKSVQNLTDGSQRPPALFDGSALVETLHDEDPASEEMDGVEDDDVEGEEGDVEDEESEAEDEGDEDHGDDAPPSVPHQERGTPLRRANAVAYGPALPAPVIAKPVQPGPFSNGPSGPTAYAPPSIRNSSSAGNGNVRPTDRGKLQAALDDLIGARALIDEVLKEG